MVKRRSMGKAFFLRGKSVPTARAGGLELPAEHAEAQARIDQNWLRVFKRLLERHPEQAQVWLDTHAEQWAHTVARGRPTGIGSPEAAAEARRLMTARVSAREPWDEQAFGDNSGKSYSVKKFVDWATANLPVTAVPIAELEHNLEWLSDTARHEVDTKFPLLVLEEQDGGLSVADGLNRLDKLVREGADVAQCYVIDADTVAALKDEFERVAFGSGGLALDLEDKGSNIHSSPVTEAVTDPSVTGPTESFTDSPHGDPGDEEHLHMVNASAEVQRLYSYLKERNFSVGQWWHLVEELVPDALDRAGITPDDYALYTLDGIDRDDDATELLERNEELIESDEPIEREATLNGEQRWAAKLPPPVPEGMEIRNQGGSFYLVEKGTDPDDWDLLALAVLRVEPAGKTSSGDPVWKPKWSESFYNGQGYGKALYNYVLGWVKRGGGWLRPDNLLTDASAAVWREIINEWPKVEKREMTKAPNIRRLDMEEYALGSQLPELGKYVREAAQASVRHPHQYEWGNFEKGADDERHPHTSVPEPPIKNEQAVQPGESAGDYYKSIAQNYGALNPGQRSKLQHYDYRAHEPAIDDLVKQHGYEVYYAGGKYGRPDLEKRNYTTGHLMVYDPTPGQGGDFGDEALTRSWRKIHELSHGLSYDELNQKYGEGRRIGKLGTHRTLREAKRAVEWEWLTVHKQRALSEEVGHPIDDRTFAREVNTVMHDAVHRAVTGKFTNPDEEGFAPHDYVVPLNVALGQLEEAARRMGLKSEDDLLPKKRSAWTLSANDGLAQSVNMPDEDEIEAHARALRLDEYDLQDLYEIHHGDMALVLDELRWETVKLQRTREYEQRHPRPTGPEPKPMRDVTPKAPTIRGLLPARTSAWSLQAAMDLAPYKSVKWNYTPKQLADAEWFATAAARGPTETRMEALPVGQLQRINFNRRDQVDPKGGPKYVEQLVQAFLAGEPIPPCVAYEDSRRPGSYVLHDGNHRVTAWKLLWGRIRRKLGGETPPVPCVVYSTTPPEGDKTAERSAWQLTARERKQTNSVRNLLRREANAKLKRRLQDDYAFINEAMALDVGAGTQYGLWVQKALHAGASGGYDPTTDPATFLQVCNQYLVELDGLARRLRFNPKLAETTEPTIDKLYKLVVTKRAELQELLKTKGEESAAKFVIHSPNIVETLNFDAATFLHGKSSGKRWMPWCGGNRRANYSNYGGGNLRRFIVYPKGPTEFPVINGQKVPFSKYAFTVSVSMSSKQLNNINDPDNAYPSNGSFDRSGAERATDMVSDLLGLSLDIEEQVDDAWVEAGVKAAAEDWEAIGINEPEVAAEWEDNGFDPDSAKSWIDVNIGSPSEAGSCVDSGITTPDLLVELLGLTGLSVSRRSISCLTEAYNTGMTLELLKLFPEHTDVLLDFSDKFEPSLLKALAAYTPTLSPNQVRFALRQLTRSDDVDAIVAYARQSYIEGTPSQSAPESLPLEGTPSLMQLTDMVDYAMRAQPKPNKVIEVTPADVEQRQPDNSVIEVTPADVEEQPHV